MLIVTSTVPSLALISVVVTGLPSYVLDELPERFALAVVSVITYEPSPLILALDQSRFSKLLLFCSILFLPDSDNSTVYTPTLLGAVV